jgi:hypothetical protein
VLVNLNFIFGAFLHYLLTLLKENLVGMEMINVLKQVTWVVPILEGCPLNNGDTLNSCHTVVSKQKPWCKRLLAQGQWEYPFFVIIKSYDMKVLSKN